MSAKGSGSGVEVRATSIRIAFTFEGKPCKETFKIKGEPAKPTVPNVERAQKIAKEIRDKIKYGTFVRDEYFPSRADATTASGHTFGQQLQDWLSVQRRSEATMQPYRSAASFWASAACGSGTLGERPLGAVLHSDILRALAARPELRAKTVKNYVSIGKRAMTLAQRDKRLADNPFDGLQAVKEQADDPDPFSLDEVEAILAYMQTHYPAPIWNYTEYKFFTGVRTGESFGLHWPNVDLRSKHIKVAEQLARGEAKKFTKTKTARKVILNSRAMAAIERQRQHTFMAAKHVFLNPIDGTPFDNERDFREKFWTPCLRALKIRYRRPYNTRHTYATMMLMAGRTPGWCANQLGHSKQVFWKVYANWIEGGQDDVEMAALEGWLSGTKAVPRESSGES